MRDFHAKNDRSELPMTGKLPQRRHGLRTTAKPLPHRDAPRSRHHVLAGMLFAFVMLLTACGGESKASDPGDAKPKQNASAAHNADDVMYLQMMIVHRQQALDMARLVPGRSKDAEVTKLAAAVEKESAGEIQQMRSWLTAWSKPTSLQGPANSHAAHGGLPAIGPAEMKTLKQAEGRGFDITFLNLLLGHQGNAVEMSKVELQKGANPAAKTYAQGTMERTRDMTSRLLGMLNT
ncbi:DUF305 domain-containing protein [Actinomadura sp. 3N508]|uniref:DUF305 domain-containing protein n=1 Tax=Actinomadura sp. 3N508 TaxID=3375153 RepID=UPI00379E7496